MHIITLTWPATIDEAYLVQNDLRNRVRVENDLGPVRLIAGIDVSYNLTTNKTRAFIVLVDAKTLEPVAEAKAETDTLFPYVPGFLSFREIPAILAAYDRLPIEPDLLMVDGQGIAHPRRLGIASHLGVLLDMPSIGVAKSRLVGLYAEPGQHKGDQEALMYKKERVGTVLRSRAKVKPLFVSPGHRVDVATATRIVVQCLTKYRLPEPTRLADKWSKRKS